eukprot:TRINITY_DN1388_c0_g4_i1.p2 TRINITY_DN1388_c0_g4~~TRINITY_DN1388_c0_g4_i1.p2  ORF type:complete len:248 (+),score=61.35 TRINITY_DN1388_c0_g4_i1:98-841(+)
MSEVSNTQFQEIEAPQESPKKQKKSFIKRLTKGVKKRLLNHGRQNSISNRSNISVEDSAHSSLSVTEYPTSASLQVTQEESMEGENPMQPQWSGINSPPILSQSVEEEEEFTTEGEEEEKVVVANQPEEHSEKEDDNYSTRHPHGSNHALVQLRAIITIQKHFKRYLKAKRTSSAMEDMLRKAVEEMEAESPGRREKVVEVQSEGRRSSFGEQIINKRQSFFMMKMGVATLLIALILRFAVLPLLDI